jgi:hypothetical protein
MDCCVVIHEGLLESICPDTVEFAEALANKTIEGGVRTFLGATFNYHVDELNLITFFDLYFEELMYSFLVIEGIHNRQVDRSAQVHEIGLRTVFDAFFVCDHFVFILARRLFRTRFLVL